ncbi:MAG: alpha/beta hydrolase [Clostridia bacterium]|nr:alpha/beta hydrolase [Clostridia bacterium]
MQNAMQAILWIAVILIILIAAFLLTAYVCFYRVFYATSKQKKCPDDEYPIPEGRIYEPFREQMVEWVKMARALPHRQVSIVSHDGLTLRGNYYEHHAGAPIELLMHGYRGSAERDMSGAIARCFALGHSALLIDHRGSGKSDGHVITFGVLESRDCLAWVNFILREIDENAQIIISGVSMGAATVMIAAGEELPPQVVGGLADCGYDTAKKIIKKVIAEHHYPVEIVYFFARLGGRIFGHFDVEERSPLGAMEKCRIPIIFLHGDADDFVPCDMSRACHDACTSQKKKLVVVPGAGHGLAFPVDMDLYLTEVGEFFGI